MSLPALGRRAFVGVVHLLPTPGSPGYAGEMEALLERARADALHLVEGGVDALIVENFGDAPFFPRRVPPETVASLALALEAVRTVAGDLPLGVNVLRNDARSALGLAAALDLAFLRINVHAGVAVTDQGLLEGRAARTLRERASLAPRASILADVHVKHATPLGREDLLGAARDTLERGRADALVISGPATGVAPAEADLRRVRDALPRATIYLGSGLDFENAERLLPSVDGAIVGTALEAEGRTAGPVDQARVARMRELFDRLQQASG